MVGVVSFLLVDLDALIKSLPFPADVEVPEINLGFKLLALVQPGVLLSAAVVIGMFLAPKVGLTAPVAESMANGNDVKAAVGPLIIPGLAGGLIGALAIIFTGLSARNFLPEEHLLRLGEFGQVMPLITRVLYGGITEELLIRWGVMTLLVWAGWRLIQKDRSAPGSAVFLIAIFVSAIVFAAGHLPIAYMLFPDRTFALTMFVLVANSTFGIVAGYLYWKKGLEAAMIAHGFAHLVLYAATFAGLYF